jgi:hypothetical protein
MNKPYLPAMLSISMHSKQFDILKVKLSQCSGLALFVFDVVCTIEEALLLSGLLVASQGPNMILITPSTVF